MWKHEWDPVSGNEASILALLAQRDPEKMTPEDKIRILSALKGPALEIARYMVLEDKNPSIDVRDAADSFCAWAKNLGPSQESEFRPQESEASPQEAVPSLQEYVASLQESVLGIQKFVINPQDVLANPQNMVDKLVGE